MSLLVGGVEAVQIRLTSVVEAVYGSFTSALRSAGVAAEGAFAVAAASILDVQATVNNVIAGAAASAGLGAPIVVSILFAFAAVVTFAALRAFLNGVKWIT